MQALATVPQGSFVRGNINITFGRCRDEQCVRGAAQRIVRAAKGEDVHTHVGDELLGDDGLLIVQLYAPTDDALGRVVAVVEMIETEQAGALNLTHVPLGSQGSGFGDQTFQQWGRDPWDY